MTGKVLDLDPGRDEKAGLAAEQRQSGSTRRHIPTDEPIPWRTLPGSGSKDTAGQHAPLSIPNQILQVFSHWTAIGQVMVRVKQLRQHSSVPCISADLLDS
jgi:hypothetical protein